MYANTLFLVYLWCFFAVETDGEGAVGEGALFALAVGERGE